jgi:hypothetical protein
MTRPCDENLRRTAELADRMIELAEHGDRDREDPTCGILYGVMRDAAYRLRRMAEEERERHRRDGDVRR